MDEINTNLAQENAPKRKLSSSSSSAEEDEFDDSEEASESEPEIDCDNWDHDCKILEIKHDKPHLFDCCTKVGILPTCANNLDESPNKKLKLSTQIRSNLLDANFKRNFQKAWNEKNEFISDETEIIINPFRVCVINNFLRNANVLSDLRREFSEIDWNVRSMDLYEFFQSQDLKHLSKHSALNSVYKLLETDVMKWVSELSGLDLTHISATCSLYSNTDYLLVHDDQREDRMVAFILYLTNPDGWDLDKGGALQLLTKDGEGHPSKPSRDIYPLNNQFVFFPVTNDSYHQVAEVTSLSDCRLSINGWFHTKIAPVFQTPEFKPYPQGLYGENHRQAIDFDGDLTSWINEDYLENDIVDDIQEYFEENSEISLRKFLKDEPFNELLQILKSDSLSWVKIGPPNRYCYHVVNLSDLPQVLDRFLQLFQSKEMFSLLQRYTSLELSKDAAQMKFELQRWSPGSYSLLGDYGWYNQKELDLVINFGCKDNSDVVGARTMYVTTDEQVQDALITLDPEENNLNLIYRDTARFTKYFSTLSRCRCFYTLFCSYSE